MPDVLMSPDLEDVIDLEYEAIEAAEQPELTCSLVHKEGRISGRLGSFADFRSGQSEDGIAGVEVSIDLGSQDIKNALQCGGFRTVEISMDGKTLTSRAIQDGWIQRREVRPGVTGMALLLSARKEDM